MDKAIKGVYTAYTRTMANEFVVLNFFEIKAMKLYVMMRTCYKPLKWYYKWRYNKMLEKVALSRNSLDFTVNIRESLVGNYPDLKDLLIDMDNPVMDRIIKEIVEKHPRKS